MMNDLREYGSDSDEDTHWVKRTLMKDRLQKRPLMFSTTLINRKMSQGDEEKLTPHSTVSNNHRSPSISPTMDYGRSALASPKNDSIEKGKGEKRADKATKTNVSSKLEISEEKKSRDEGLERGKRRSRSSSRDRRRRSRSSSKERRRRSRSTSREKKKKKRRSKSGSRDRKRKSRSPSKDKRRRSRTPSRERRRSSKERRRSRSPRRHRSPRDRGYFRRSRSRSPRKFRTSRRSSSPRRRHYRSKSRSHSPEARKAICRAVLPPSHGKGKDRVPTTEEVEAKLKAHMEKMKEKANEDAKNINLPSYLNPAMVNVQQFKQQQEKRKLLWSSKKAKEESSSIEPSQASWSGSAFQDDETEAKFRRLMGIRGSQSVGSGDQAEKSRKVLEDLEREYERSRAFQLSRGAGGTTGIGLGFNQGP